MNLLLFPIEHQNPGHQKMIQHTLQHYCVESLAILASTNCWGNAMKCQMEATWVWGKKKVELCIDKSVTVADLVHGSADILHVSNSTYLQIHLTLVSECISTHLPEITSLMWVISSESEGLPMHAKLQTCLSIPRIRTTY